MEKSLNSNKNIEVDPLDEMLDRTGCRTVHESLRVSKFFNLI